MNVAAAPGRRLSEAFASRDAEGLPSVIPYVTAGYPEIGDTPRLLLAAQRAGSLAAEVGVPFSDPIADGPTIQATGTKALSNGMTPRLTLQHVARARELGVTMPLALMIYVNLVMAHGIQAFAADAAAAGADAVIVPDLPAGEARQIRDAFTSSGLSLIPLVAPTTPAARISQACEGATGFVYCVSLRGTTGARPALAGEGLALLDRVRSVTNLPRALGFGISRHEHLVALRGHTEAVIVGSALLDAIAARLDDPPRAAEEFLTGLGGSSEAV